MGHHLLLSLFHLFPPSIRSFSVGETFQTLTRVLLSPYGFRASVQLRLLNMRDNRLRRLPVTLGGLEQLEELSVAGEYVSERCGCAMHCCTEPNAPGKDEQALQMRLQCGRALH